MKRDIKAGRQTAGRRPPRKVDRRVGQLAAAQASCFWGTEADSQPRSSSSSSSSDDGGGCGRGWRLAAVGGGGGGRKQAAPWPEWSVTQWLSRKVAKSLLSCRDVQLSCSCRRGGDGRDGVVVCAWLPLREGEPSQRCRASGGPARTTRLDWPGRAGLA